MDNETTIGEDTFEQRLENAYDESPQSFIELLIEEIGISGLVEGYEEGRFKLELLDEEGGNEGGGEHVSRVLEIVKNGINTGNIAEFTGSYFSDYGIEFDEQWTWVKPIEVLVTKYVPL